MTDTLFADVSYFQNPVDDSYPHEILSIRSNDGTFRDPQFWRNYRWCVDAAESGRLACFIVYAYWRPNWEQTAETLIDMVSAEGGPHPQMIVMLDLESGGNPGGDQSDGINRCYWRWAEWLGDPRRVIGYANKSDFETMWRTRPDGLRVVGAGYGRNPNLPGQIAHQYTDGQGFGGGLPEGAPPFGKCDMNAANGLSAQDFAAACGIGQIANEEDDMAGWQDTPIPTQYVKDGNGVRLAREGEQTLTMPAWQLLSWLDGRVARAEGALNEINGKLDSLLLRDKA